MGTIAEALKQEGKAEGLVAGEILGREKGLAEGQARGKAEGKAEGIAEGIAEGEARGEARSLMRLLVKRFGPLPDPVGAHRSRPGALRNLIAGSIVFLMPLIWRRYLQNGVITEVAAGTGNQGASCS